MSSDIGSDHNAHQSVLLYPIPIRPSESGAWMNAPGNFIRVLGWATAGFSIPRCFLVLDHKRQAELTGPERGQARKGGREIRHRGYASTKLFGVRGRDVRDALSSLRMRAGGRAKKLELFEFRRSLSRPA